MSQHPELKMTFDDCLKGAVFVLGGLFLIYCILNALFGEWWALVIARVVVSLSLAGVITLAVMAIIQKIKLNRHLANARIAKARAASGFAVIQDPKGTQQVIYDARNNSWRHFFRPGSVKMLDAMEELQRDNDEYQREEEISQLEPLLPVLDQLSRLLIIGGMGTGKSELLRHLAAGRVQRGHVIICDSHAAPDTWPDYCQVAGIGRNYQEIEAAVNYVCDELDRRYKERSGGVKKFKTITLIIDELFVLHQFLDMGQQFKSLLAESRKVGIELIMAGQSDRANALGLSGNKDLIAGFEAVVYLDRDDDGRYVAEVKGGKRSRNCLHPGPYRGGGGNGGRWGGGSQSSQSSYGSYAENDGKNGNYRREYQEHQEQEQLFIPMNDFHADFQEKEIVRLYRLGNSLSSIRRSVFGKNGGGKYINMIKNTLQSRGILA